MRRDFIEADAAVPLHVLLGVDFQFLVGVHRHQHRANVGLKNRIKAGKGYTGSGGTDRVHLEDGHPSSCAGDTAEGFQTGQGG